jgi:hypothetical protein
MVSCFLVPFVYLDFHEKNKLSNTFFQEIVLYPKSCQMPEHVCLLPYYEEGNLAPWLNIHFLGISWLCSTVVWHSLATVATSQKNRE